MFSPAPPIAPTLRTHSLARQAYGEIRNRILRGELALGAVLSRRQLAVALQMSVPPVSEALQHLERDGLVESKPRVGTRVRLPTAREIEDRGLVREALESQSARLFAERATAEERENLSAMGRRVDQLYACCEAKNADRNFLFSVNSYHMSLHLRIAECARCPALRDAIEKEQVLIFNWLYDTAVERRTLAADHHARLTVALARGTVEEADAAMREHIRFGVREVLAKFNSEEGASWRRKKSPASAC